MVAWWGTRDEVSPRLKTEFDAMHTIFKDTFILTVPKWEPLYWTGVVEVNMKGIPQRDHRLQIVYPEGFPHSPPEAYVREPRGLYSEKHQFEDGQLCLFNPKDGQTYGWNPSSSTAATIAGWAIQWLYAYYTYRATGRWPGLEERVVNR